jgi:hypothetical protein
LILAGKVTDNTKTLQGWHALRLLLYLCSYVFYLADYKREMGDFGPDTIVTMHLVIRPPMVAKVGGSGRLWSLSLFGCECFSVAGVSCRVWGQQGTSQRLFVQYSVGFSRMPCMGMWAYNLSGESVAARMLVGTWPLGGSGVVAGRLGTVQCMHLVVQASSNHGSQSWPCPQRTHSLQHGQGMRIRFDTGDVACMQHAPAGHKVVDVQSANKMLHRMHASNQPAHWNNPRALHALMQPWPQLTFILALSSNRHAVFMTRVSRQLSVHCQLHCSSGL